MPAPGTPRATTHVWDVVRSVPFLLVRPRLLGLALAPAVINAIVATALFLYLEVHFVERALHYPMPDWLGSGLADLLRAVFWAFMLLFSAVVAAALGLGLMAPVSAPFNDIISEHIEREQLASRPDLLVAPPGLLVSAFHATIEALRRLLVAGPLALAIMLLGFVPLAGPLAAAVLGFCYAVIFLPIDAISYSLDRRRLGLGAKVSWLRERPSTWFWFGTGLALCLAFPFGFLVYSPLAAVAGTRLYCARLLGAP